MPVGRAEEGQRLLRPGLGATARLRDRRPGGAWKRPHNRQMSARVAPQHYPTPADCLRRTAMRRNVIVGFSCAFVVTVTSGDRVTGASPGVQGGQAACEKLAQLQLPDVRVTEAVPVPASAGGAATAVRVPHCRVTGVIGSEIRFTLLLPDQWNKKFLMGGGGGFVGSISNQAQRFVNDGYASVGTDTGHQSPSNTDASWALDNLERQLNFGYLAVHRTAEVAKAIIAGYYGKPTTRSYFQGCSRGGGP